MGRTHLLSRCLALSFSLSGEDTVASQILHCDSQEDLHLWCCRTSGTFKAVSPVSRILIKDTVRCKRLLAVGHQGWLSGMLATNRPSRWVTAKYLMPFNQPFATLDQKPLACTNVAHGAKRPFAP